MNEKTRKLNRTVRLLLLMLLVVVFAAWTGLGSMTGFAKTEQKPYTGSYGIEGKYMADVSSVGSTKLTLYRVGSFDRDKDGKSIIDLDDAFNCTLPETSKDDEHWVSDWLDVAHTIEMQIDADSTLQDRLKAGETTTDEGGFYAFDKLASGVYLITGESKEVTDQATGKTTYWWPQAMLVQVLQSTAEANLKPATSEQQKFQVIKTWSGGAEARPASIKVHVSYDGKEIAGSPFTLDESNHWTAKWTAGKDQTDASKWEVVEEMGEAAVNFTSVITGPGTGEIGTYNITNTYNPPVTDKTLELVKRVPEYVQHSNNVSTVFTFVVTGYIGTQQVLYKTVAVEFTGPGEKTLNVGKIPDGLTRLVVREVDSPNYTVVGNAEKEATLDGDTYSVTFENKYDKTTNFEGGVINKYKQSGGGYKFDSREGRVKK